MAVVPVDERRAIVEEATTNTLRQIQLHSKTIDDLPLAEVVVGIDKVELNGNRSANMNSIAVFASEKSGPSWEDF